MSTGTDAQPPQLFDELKKSRTDLLKVAGPVVLVTVLAFLIAFYFVEPPPPGQLVIATGPATGNYFAAAQQYSPVFEKSGVQLKVRKTAGSIENYQLLAEDDSVHVAIVQGGTAPAKINGEQFESLCTLYLEPLWIFHRSDAPINSLLDLAGKRIATGEVGSGTQRLAQTLLHANGVQDATGGTVFVQQSQTRSIEMLTAGEVDAAFFVLAAKSPVISRLLGAGQLKLLSLSRAEAYAQRFPFLEHVVLPQGVVDLQRDLPHTDVHLIAPAANLVATPALHDAFIAVLLEAATEAHQTGGLVSSRGEFPSLHGVEFKPNSAARHYFKNGPSLFQKYLGFWLSSLIDRAKILLLPLFILIVPLIKLAPPVYRWRIHSRIYRWYGVLREIDQLIRNASNKELQESADKLKRIDLELETVNVPLSYMEEFYHLRLHIDLIKRRLADSKTASSNTPPSQRR